MKGKVKALNTKEKEIPNKEASARETKVKVKSSTELESSQENNPLLTLAMSASDGVTTLSKSVRVFQNNKTDIPPFYFFYYYLHILLS